jgi:rRNA maturation endonuclease Nob1
MNVVPARSCEGYSMSWNLNLFSGPKFTIGCGACPHVFEQRIPVRDYPTVICPACGTLNRLNLVAEGGV